MEQINLFKILEQDKDIIKQIKPKLRKFGIDELSKRKFKKDCTYTFKEIKETLLRCKTYKEYIKELFNELSRYSLVVTDVYDYIDKTDKINYIELRENCIILATDCCVGPIYNLEMLKQRLNEVEVVWIKN